ncbi:unnamed protein product [Lasius platythorax]|uniref:Uncharacterized protein n=1 Tax=Lasius platythorax TaxID=488582 RepID=A0AAV2MZQ7_9HYME
MPLGDFVKIWWEVRLTVEGIKSEPAKRLLTFINEKEKSLLDNPVVLAAIYLDPRIRRLFPKEKLEGTKKFLKTLASQIISVRSLARRFCCDTNRRSSDIFTARSFVVCGKGG